MYCIGGGRALKTAYNISVQNSQGNRTLERPRPRREDNIKIDCEDVDWIYVSRDNFRWRTLVGTIMKFRIP